MILLGADRKSVRVFERTIDGKTLEFLMKPETGEAVDAETGSLWDFSGKCTGGGLSGKQLKKVSAIKDYWFDWQSYHRETKLYALGSR